MTTQNSPNNNKPYRGPLGLLKVLRKNIIMRTVLVVITIILTIVLIFSLTVAWQTNVVQTGGLTFTAENWNFSGQVIIDDQAIKMAPGDSGIIPMRMINQSSGLVAASVTVSKKQMEKLHDRVFFYVDSAAVRNGETMERVYVSSKSSYTYTVFPYGELMLTEDSQNAPLLKWEWVYDNLGYYVLGEKTDDGVVQVEEYLRPIEYEYDEMRTTFDNDGQLLTVDGVIGVEEFLAQISKGDGYAGNIDFAGKTAAGYYPVDVNDNGYGVWAYLCNRSEIEVASVEDTALGTKHQDLGTARVTVTGQNSREEGVKVNNEEELMNALKGSGVNMVSLSRDVVLTKSIELDGSSRTMIDLAGHKLTSSAANIIDAKPGASVMVYNGVIDGTGITGTAVNTSGANVTLSGVTVTNVGEGITIFDNRNDSGADSRVQLIGCKITAFEDGLWIYGNGSASERNTAIIVEECEIEGTNYAGIICNGTYYGTDILITKSTVKGKYAGIYFPQKNSTLTIENSTLEGDSGVVVKGGTVNIFDSKITGTGTYEGLPEDPDDLPKSGWVETGDGIYLEANYYNWDTVINISGENTVVTGTQENALAVRQFPSHDIAPQASIHISGGTYSSDVSEYLEDGYIIKQSTNEEQTVYIVSKKEEGTE